MRKFNKNNIICISYMGALISVILLSSMIFCDYEVKSKFNPYDNECTSVLFTIALIISLLVIFIHVLYCLKCYEFQN